MERNGDGGRVDRAAARTGARDLRPAGDRSGRRPSPTPVLLLLGMVAALVTGACGESREPGRIVKVEMRGNQFRPGRVEVRVGDTVRFVQRGVMEHNVAIREVPDGAPGELKKVSPYMREEGEHWDLPITEKFVTGTYRFVCTPHVQQDMEGWIVVTR